MTRRPVFIALATGMVLASAIAGAAGREIQQWRDENGVIHYGDAPPPEAIRNGRTVLNEQGVVVREVPAQMSPAEAAEARQRQEDEARRRAQDSFLLTTYTRVADIERVRDDQLALIDGQIELARGSLTSSEQKLGSVQKRMNGFWPYSSAPNARRLPDNLASEAVAALGERRSMEAALQRHQQRREETREKFDSDISRYKELTSRPSIR